ncbi:MAG: hypothetical protein KGD65_16595 [Candidatus Lokiarchaeota archaeon]|nr:hypothetical protein [Candidatus Lokiarchaeota archaeon]
MNDNLKYHEILEEDLVLEMEWLKEEFEIQFKSKLEKFSQMDKKIANDLLNYILETTDVHENFLLLNKLEDVTKNIEKAYPSLFT